MPASERLKAASGDYSRVCKQTVPAAVAFSLPSAFPPSEPSRESPCGVKNKAHVAETYLSLSYPLPPTAAPPIRTLTENDVRRLLVLLAPKVHEKTFSFFSAFRWRKAAKATRPIPMPASERLKAASGDYSRVCKQTVPAALAFSPPSALSLSEPSRGSPCGVKNKAHVTETYLSLFILCRPWRHHKSALPRRTTCGGFWYFWPQKYKGKVHETCRFSKIHTSEQKSNSRGRKRAVARAGSGTKKADDFFKSSAVVAGGGLEPPTSGL